MSKPLTSGSGIASHTVSAISLEQYYSMINFSQSPGCTNQLFHLRDLAACYNVDIAGKNHNEAAFAIIQKIVRDISSEKGIPGNLGVEKEPRFVFNGQSADQLCRFFISKKNRGDVGIFVDDPKTNLCIIEVHSSPFVATIRKVAIDLIEILRVVKAHGITECAMTGFAFPKLDIDQCIVKVTVLYIPDEIVFSTKCKEVAKEDFQKELCSAIVNNNHLLSKCKGKEILDTAEKCIIPLSPEELVKFGTNAIQRRAYYGVLIEVEQEGIVYCYKKPTLNTSWRRLLYFDKPSNYRIHYQRPNDSFFRYQKVMHDPLSNKEVSMCLRDFIPKVVKIVENLCSDGFEHKDVRIPNICFDKNCEPILIDLDNSVKIHCSEQKLWDLTTFSEDLKKRIVEYFPNLEADDFFKEFSQGVYDEEKLQSSPIVKKSTKLVEEIINERAM